MTTLERVGRGGTATFLDARWQDGTGSLVDPTSPLVDIIDANGIEVEPDVVPERISLGHWRYPAPGYAVAVDAPLGIWVARWSGAINGVPVTADDLWEVVAAGTVVVDDGFWPTVADLAVAARTTIAAEDEAHAQMLLDGAKAAVQEYTGQQFEATVADTATIRGTTTLDLWLPQRPVTAVSDITVNGAAIASTAWTWTEDGRVVLKPWSLDAFDSWPPPSSWGAPGVLVVVTYDHGYTSLPQAVWDLVLGVARRRLVTPDAGVVTQESLGSYLVSYGRQMPAELTPGEKAVLDAYRRPPTSVLLVREQ